MKTKQTMTPSKLLLLSIVACSPLALSAQSNTNVPVKEIHPDGSTSTYTDFEHKNESARDKDATRNERKKAENREELNKHIDTNNDGVITDEERKAYKNRKEPMKDHLDTNKDGKISSEEKAAGKVKHDKWVDKHVDTNNDGVISEEEKAAAKQEWISKADTNGDGNVSKEEKNAFKKKYPERTLPDVD